MLGFGPGIEGVAKPQRGVRGGEVVAGGTPETVAGNPRSFIGQYLAPMLCETKLTNGQLRETAE